MGRNRERWLAALEAVELEMHGSSHTRCKVAVGLDLAATASILNTDISSGLPIRQAVDRALAMEGSTPLRTPSKTAA